MTFLAPLAGLALLALPAIVLLYFLKVKRPEVRVGSLLFWRPYVADRQANAPWQRLRRSLLLLVQLLVALFVAGSLLRPGLIGAAGVAATTVVIIEASPSMEAVDVGGSRFEVALQRTRELAGQLAPGQQLAVILAGPHAQLLVPPTEDAALVRAALARARPAGSAGNFGEAASLANSILQGRPAGSILLLGDGHLEVPPTPPRLLAPLTYVSIGSTGENVAVEALSRSPSGSVFLRLANYGRGARDLRVELRADGRLVDVLPAHVEGNNTVDLTWDRLPAGTQVLEAKLTPSDAFPADDRAWLVTAAPPPHPVLLVSTGNAFLERALRLRPGVELTVVKPQDYRPQGRYDLYVFDGFLPSGRLPEPSLLIAPPPGQGPLPLGQPLDPGAVLAANPRESLLRDVVLKDVHVLTAGQVRAPADWRPVIEAASTPLLLVHEAEPRSALFTFDLHHSDLPLRAAFPILVQNLLGYLLPGGFENQVFSPGQAVNLAPEPGAVQVEVTTPDRRNFRLRPPLAPFTETSELGVYTVRERLPQGDRLSRFVVQFRDPGISRIAPGAAPLTQEVEKPQGPPPRGTLEIWPWLAVAALGLLTLEWVVYLGGLEVLRRRFA